MVNDERIQSCKLRAQSLPKLSWDLTIWPNLSKSKVQIGLCLRVHESLTERRKVIEWIGDQF